jgi:Holliday junction resolvase RusA-like endonuclease
MITTKQGKRLLLPSKQYAEFEKEAVKQLLWKYGNMEAIDEPINLKAIFYREANYKSDLVNYMQALQDVLVKAGILKDDNVKIVQSIDGSRVLTDKESPRIEVTIERLAEC